MSVDVSPDGTELAFDLLGDLYVMPAAGGVPEQLTRGPDWDQAPLFSVDGKDVYFISDRKGARNIWKQSARDGSVRQVTKSRSDILGVLNWSNDRRRIIAARGNIDVNNAEVSLYEINPHTGEMAELQRKDGPWIDMDTFERLRRRIRTFSGVESPRGTTYFSEASFRNDPPGFAVRLYALDQRTDLRERITEARAPYNDYSPQISPDGSLLAWFRQYDDRRTQIRVRDLVTLSERPIVEIQGADDPAYGASHPERPRYTFTPDGLHLVYWHAGKIWSAKVSNGERRTIPFRVEVRREIQPRSQPLAIDPIGDPRARIVRWPTVSEDGRWLAFSAFGYIWIQDLQSDSVRRLTCSTDFEYMPALSPDGQSIAYVAFSRDAPDYLAARLMVADRRTGTVRELLAEANSAYLLPRWSPDHTKIAAIQESPTENGLEARFGWTSSRAGSFNSVAPAPASSERLALSLSARYVGFDAKGERIAFSYPRSRDEMVLKAADLDGGEAVEIAIVRGDIIGLVPSPDFRHLLLTARDASLWLYARGGVGVANVSLTDTSVQPVGVAGGYYAAWTDRARFVSSAGTKVSFHEPGNAGSSSSREIVITATKASKPVAFHGARILTMAGANGLGPIIDHGTIRVRGTYIVELGPENAVAIPNDTVVIDSRGMTILPGFVDSHYHRIGGSEGALGVSGFKLPNRAVGDATAITYGITTAWEPGGVVDDGAAAVADFQRAGRILGPRWSLSASGAVGYPWSRLRTYEDARRAVEMQKAIGATVLKEYNTPYREQRKWLSDAARTSGLGIYSHLQSFDGAMTRIVDGYSGGEHSYIPVPYFKDVAEMMRQSGFVWTPNILIANGSVDFAGSRPETEGTIRETAMSSETRSEGRAPPADSGHPDHRTARIARQASAAFAAGISLGVSGHNMPGDRLHTEMRYLHEGGMGIAEVLRAATAGNAAKLGLSRYIGSLEPGKIADFVVLEEDPLIDIDNTTSVRYTIQGGRVYDSENQRQMLEAEGASPCISELGPG